MIFTIVNPRPGGPRIHLRPGGGGAHLTPPLLNPLLGGIAEKREQCWIAHQRTVRNHLFHFLAQVNIEVMTGQWMKSSRYTLLALAPDLIELEPRSWHHSIPLVTASRMMYNMTLLGQFLKMTWPKARSRSAFELTWSICISIDSQWWSKHDDVKIKALAPFSAELLA